MLLVCNQFNSQLNVHHPHLLTDTASADMQCNFLHTRKRSLLAYAMQAMQTSANEPTTMPGELDAANSYAAAYGSMALFPLCAALAADKRSI